MYLKNNGPNGWEARITYHDLMGKKKQAHKRGFKTKREAEEWGRKFLATQQNNIDVTFEAFWEIYRNDFKERLRQNTMNTKTYIVELKILPYFGEMKMIDIKAVDVRRWQNELMKEGYSQTYLRKINTELSCIFNYAINFFELPKNPVKQAGSIGKANADEMLYWSKEEFGEFLKAVEDKELSYYAFLILFWTGIRMGELLALTIGDFNPDAKTITISKSFQRIKGKNIISEPKTEKSKRTVTLPDFLVDELTEFVGKLYGYTKEDRLFSQISKSYLEKEMLRGVKISGVKKIRVHDLRHSHASLLISQLGASPQLVADRLGHEKITTTLQTYSHLYPDQSRTLADQLNDLSTDNNDEAKEQEDE